MAVNQEVKNIVSEIKYRCDLTQSEIAKELGIKNTYLSDVVNGRVPFSDNLKNNIYEVFSERMGWRVEKEYDLEGKKLKTSTSEVAQISYKEGRPFYNIDWALGFEGVYDDPEYVEFNIDFPPANKPQVNWFRGRGRSMLGEIDSGDYVALEEIVDFSWFPLGRIYGVITKNGFRTIKRVVQSKNPNSWTLMSSNPDKDTYPDQDLPKDMVERLFKVIYVIKDLNE